MTIVLTLLRHTQKAGRARGRYMKVPEDNTCAFTGAFISKPRPGFWRGEGGVELGMVHYTSGARL